MASVTGMTLVKRFTYRGDPLEEFSNTYHFVNPPPSDAATWLSLEGSIRSLEEKCYVGGVSWVRSYGYDSDDPKASAVWSVDHTIPGPPPVGTMTPPTGPGGAGDQAAMLWWKTSRLSSKGKPVYLRKYFHQPFLNTANRDQLDPAYVTALNGFVSLTLGVEGLWGGLRSRTHPDPVIASGVGAWVTTRTLKRRGKRPLAP